MQLPESGLDRRYCYYGHKADQSIQDQLTLWVVVAIYRGNRLNRWFAAHPQIANKGYSKESFQIPLGGCHGGTTWDRIM